MNILYIYMITCRGRRTLDPKFGFNIGTSDTKHLLIGYKKVYY